MGEKNKTSLNKQQIRYSEDERQEKLLCHKRRAGLGHFFIQLFSYAESPL